MTNTDILKQVKDFLTKQYETIKVLDEPGTNGGKIRDISGKITETLTEMIWHAFEKKYPNVKAKIYIGDDKPYRIEDNDGNYIEESVDRHCYINDKLVLAIECKTYLDKCYMQRADSDFNLMKSYNHDFKAIIISVENSIADNSYNFFLNRGNIDKVYYLAEGKRNSAKLKKICYHQERIKDDLILDLINDIEKCFTNPLVQEESM